VFDEGARRGCGLRYQVVAGRRARRLPVPEGLPGDSARKPGERGHKGLGLHQRDTGPKSDPAGRFRIEGLYRRAARSEHGKEFGGPTEYLSRARAVVCRDEVDLGKYLL
jgi:hypothetical protein